MSILHVVSIHIKAYYNRPYIEIQTIGLHVFNFIIYVFLEFNQGCSEPIPFVQKCDKHTAQ